MTTQADSTLPPATPMMESRKFRALLLAMVVYFLPVVMTFFLVLTKNADKHDFFEVTKWAGLGLSPAFLAYIGGVALEGWAEKRPSTTNVATTSPIVMTSTPSGAAAAVAGFEKG